MINSFQKWGQDVKHWYDKMVAAFQQSVADGSSYEFNSFDAGYTAGVSDALSTPTKLMESGQTGTDWSQKPNDADAIRSAKAGSIEAAGAVPGVLDLSALNVLARVYASSYASPHHITFTVEGLRQLIAEALASPPAVPLDDARLLGHAGTDDQLATDLEALRQSHWTHWTAAENNTAAVAVRVLRELRVWRALLSAQPAGDRELLQQALTTLEAIRNDTDGTGSRTMLDDDLGPDVDAAIAAIRSRLTPKPAGEGKAE